jgi:dTDP-glucose pyrophosphorylase
MGLCGEGSRFKNIGYTIPKYLIVYNGKTMLQHSVDTLKIPGDWYFVVRQDHIDNINYLEDMLKGMGTVIVIPGSTEGAAQSLLMAKEHIRDTAAPIISINCDQYLNWNPTEFINVMNTNPSVNYILTYTETNPKCSYVFKNPETNNVILVREKKVISREATIGVYHWAYTTDFFTDCEKMIDEKVKDNGEYYVAPVYNYSIARGLEVKTFHLDKTQFYPVGTPNDLVKAFELLSKDI